MNANLPSVTEKELNLLRAIHDDEFQDGNDPVDNPIWTDDVIDDHSGAAVLGSLIKKGLAGSDDHGMDSGRKDACCWITALGAEVLAA